MADKNNPFKGLKVGDRVDMTKLRFSKQADYYGTTLNDIVSVLKAKHTDDFKLKWCANLISVLEEYYKEVPWDAVKYAKEKCIPLMEKLVDKSTFEKMNDFFDYYKKLYAFCGRNDLECFIDYMEFEKNNKVLAKRRQILMPFIAALNRLDHDPNLKYVIASFPPSSGKSFSVNYYTAWTYGRDINNSNLRLSYNDELVLGFSRSIKDIISSPQFADVFTRYKLFNGKPFEKEKESDWKIKGANVLTSHISRTRDGGTTGVRANKTIIFDDMTKGAEEATNSAVHQAYYNKWKTEWYNRKDGKNTKYVFLGTMWSPEDILNRVREDREKISPLEPSKEYPYTWESEDGSTIVIRVPLLDENDESTCPDAYTTEEAREIRDTTDPYLYSCVYQQEPIAPTGLEFADELLEHYDKLPLEEDGSPAYSDFCKASLDPARRGKDNVSMPIFTKGEDGKYYFIDCIFKQKPMSDLYDEIVDKIIEHNIIEFVIENNTDTSLKAIIELKLEEKGFKNCIIKEKYNVKKKEDRIKETRGHIKKFINFKEKRNIIPNTDYGRFMKNFTTYSFDYPNKHDDAADSIALFVSECILKTGAVSKPIPINRKDYGI